MTDADIIEAVLKREGGFVDNSSDSGGPTNLGITLPTLSSYLGRQATVDDLKSLSHTDASRIYYSRFVALPGFDRIHNDELRAVVIDAGVNHGPANATRMLQRVLKVPVDGVIGTTTLTAANVLDGFAIARRFLAERLRFYGRLISDDHSQAVFAAGWMNRVAEQIEELA